MVKEFLIGGVIVKDGATYNTEEMTAIFNDRLEHGWSWAAPNDKYICRVDGQWIIEEYFVVIDTYHVKIYLDKNSFSKLCDPIEYKSNGNPIVYRCEIKKNINHEN